MCTRMRPGRLPSGQIAVYTAPLSTGEASVTASHHTRWRGGWRAAVNPSAGSHLHNNKSMSPAGAQQHCTDALWRTTPEARAGWAALSPAGWLQPARVHHCTTAAVPLLLMPTSPTADKDSVQQGVRGWTTPPPMRRDVKHRVCGARLLHGHPALITENPHWHTHHASASPLLVAHAVCHKGGWQLLARHHWACSHWLVLHEGPLVRHDRAAPAAGLVDGHLGSCEAAHCCCDAWGVGNHCCRDACSKRRGEGPGATYVRGHLSQVVWSLYGA